ncbi:alpha-ketoacid dehydrogenase subunit beta [Streptomyces sp. TS71-3]|uniref:alpha-ketoacid dehydrogenase subunit beta n=1 Tax=Streptomyces sp. TS71-3 TaxID=2733862 RepID=UPI001B294A5A|nr:transketolase C-terminal domain-containing protein [Streptomyces sp. TS71-3]GHJ40783.1 TPP-dependent acetoin dehydrogenase complex, E1 protein subunit beta [Streptomyces sp. TS71-3]
MPDDEIIKVNYSGAVNAALRRVLAEVPQTLLYGEDVAKPGGVHGVTKGLWKEFGERVFDTPISESAILGSAVGAAMMGRRPIVEIMWADFFLVALDQMINQAANVRYVSGGRLTAPLVVRTQQGNSPGACAQHSQNLEALFLHVPGLRVAMPSTPQDAYDTMVSAVYCDDPVVVFDNRTLYFGEKQEIVTGRPPAPVGGSLRRRSGSAATVVTWGAITHRVLTAADRLAERGVRVTVIELPWLNPFDGDAVIDSVSRTDGRLAVVHEANVTAGFGAEVVARVAEAGVLRGRPVRIGVPDSRIPASPELAAALIPDVDRITMEVGRLAGE